MKIPFEKQVQWTHGEPDMCSQICKYCYLCIFGSNIYKLAITCTKQLSGESFSFDLIV